MTSILGRAERCSEELTSKLMWRVNSQETFKDPSSDLASRNFAWYRVFIEFFVCGFTMSTKDLRDNYLILLHDSSPR